jgi:hypothetical protein
MVFYDSDSRQSSVPQSSSGKLLEEIAFYFVDLQQPEQDPKKY